MKVSIASDHGGFDLKESIKAHLLEKGYEVKDCGCYSKDRCDYPDFARVAAQDVADGISDRGVVVCTTGIGVSIVANKVKGIRCALVTSAQVAELTRLHNDSNVIAFGAISVTPEQANEYVDIYLTTPFSGDERHANRIAKIEG